MRVVEKTTKKIVIELTSFELDRSGFDHIWDEIRDIYPQDIYEIISVKETSEGMLMLVTLKVINS